MLAHRGWQGGGDANEGGDDVRDIAVSQDGRWIVTGMVGGDVTVWNGRNHLKVTEFDAHNHYVNAVDISPDATKFATGSSDKTACVWSLSTGERLLGPMKHDFEVVAAKFSPNGRLIATATEDRDSVRVYDSRNGSLLVEFPVKVNWGFNQSLAWASDSMQLFALSHDGYIHRVDVLAETTLAKWQIHNRNDPTCIALASNGTFLAASARSSVSFWDTTTREQIGTVIKYTHHVSAMVMSSNCDLVTSGDERITLQSLRGILPSLYIDKVS